MTAKNKRNKDIKNVVGEFILVAAHDDFDLKIPKKKRKYTLVMRRFVRAYPFIRKGKVLNDGKKQKK